jgi:chemotaxis methyl-accepting protein methylase
MLELARRLLDEKEKGSTLRIAVVASSNGAEVYSFLWTIRSVRPDLKVEMHAMDISKEILEIAQKGVYSLINPELVESPIFERMTEQEMKEMFDREGNRVKIKSWLQDGITWNLGDASDPEIINTLGTQDMVVANNFLCHMEPPDAEKCLQNMERMVKPGGYIFVSGVDLDVRTRVASDLVWKPVRLLIEDIHDGDQVLRNDWPLKWWGLEPLNKKRLDWKIRYSAVFQMDK